MSFWDWFIGKKTRETSAEVEDYDPDRAGSMIVAVGGPGTGKTLLTVRLALRAAYDAGLPFAAIDTNGDVEVYRKAACARIRAIKHRSEGESDLLDWLEDKRCVRTYRDAGEFSALIESYRKNASKQKRREPSLYCFIDEGGMQRRDSESFWDMAASFRNAGITAYTTCHKDTDISRVGRQAIRAVMLFEGYEGTVNFFGVDIEARNTTPPMSDYVVYIDHTRELKKWDHAKRWHDPPKCLVAPVQPTAVDPSMVKV